MSYSNPNYDVSDTTQYEHARPASAEGLDIAGSSGYMEPGVGAGDESPYMEVNTEAPPYAEVHRDALCAQPSTDYDAALYDNASPGHGAALYAQPNTGHDANLYDNISPGHGAALYSQPNPGRGAIALPGYHVEPREDSYMAIAPAADC